jgi:hypothetical protein
MHNQYFVISLKQALTRIEMGTRLLRNHQRYKITRIQVANGAFYELFYDDYLHDYMYVSIVAYVSAT